MVLKRTIDRKSKLDPKWNGPFIVKNDSEVGSYIILDINQTKDIIANIKDLKRIYKGTKLDRMKCRHEDVSKKSGGDIVEDELIKRRKCNICDMTFK
ncbi:hypothetical protein COBT_002562 [Conglomerata obtusa]